MAAKKRAKKSKKEEVVQEEKPLDIFEKFREKLKEIKNNN